MNKNKPESSSSSRINSALSAALIVLLSVTILAVLVMGGMFVMRIINNVPADITPDVTDAPGIDTLPAVDTEEPDTSALPSTDAPPTVQVTEPVTEPVTEAPDVPAIADGVFLPETADGGEDYLKRLVFLGDSTTYHMHHYTDLDDAQIWVPQAGTLDLYDITAKSVAMPVSGVDYRDWVDAPITSVLSSQKPDILIVTLGINFSAFYGKEEHGWTMDKKETYFKLQISNIKKMVEQYSPDTTLVFQTIYPVIDAELIEDGSPIRNEHVKLRNSWLIEICEELKIPLLKTEDVLMNEHGELKKEFNTYHLDGVHINPDGYAAILNYVRTHTVP